MTCIIFSHINDYTNPQLLSLYSFIEKIINKNHLTLNKDEEFKLIESLRKSIALSQSRYRAESIINDFSKMDTNQIIRFIKDYQHLRTNLQNISDDIYRLDFAIDSLMMNNSDRTKESQSIQSNDMQTLLNELKAKHRIFTSSGQDLQYLKLELSNKSEHIDNMMERIHVVKFFYLSIPVVDEEIQEELVRISSELSKLYDEIICILNYSSINISD